MTYSVIIQSSAEEDIRRLVFYIAYKLENPYAALKISFKIKKRIQELSYMPERFPFFNDSKYRKTHIGKYVIFYRVDKTKNEVRVFRVLYSRRNLAKYIKR